jgi:hypothetical protein
MENARESLPVIIHDIIMVSNVPIARQLIDFAMLRFGCSEALSVLKLLLAASLLIKNWSAII